MKIPSWFRKLAAWLSEPLAIVILVFCTTTAIAQPFYIPSGSMEPTLQIGDALIGSKFAYGYSRYSVPLALGPRLQTRLFSRSPKRGDVVVFSLPRDPKVTYVKRLIGLPGDRIQMVEGRPPLLINDAMPLPLVAAGAAG